MGAVNTTVDIDVHVLGDWSEIVEKGTTFVAVAGTEVDPLHDAWIVQCGIRLTVASALNGAEIIQRTEVVGAGFAGISHWFADTPTPQTACGARSATFLSPFNIPVPWRIPNVAEQVGKMRFNLDTNAAVTTNLALGVLSAPPGVFRRLY